MGGISDAFGEQDNPASVSGGADFPDRVPAIIVSNSQGVQVNLGGAGWQVNFFGSPNSEAAPEEFRTDLLALLHAVDDEALRASLPPHLAPGADVLHMSRTVRMISRVRRPPERKESDGAGQKYAVPADADKRAGEPLVPWEDAAAAHNQLVVLADPGMGKSWLLRLETHRLASEALQLLEQSPGPAEVRIPLPIRADALAAAMGRTLAEAMAGYLVGQGLLPARSAGLMRDLIASGGAVLLVDALDEVPREAARRIEQAPLKRLEDLLREWMERCPGTARFVVTSRLVGYTGLPVPGARETELLPFTATDIDSAVRAWNLPAASAAQLRERLRDPAAAGMARIPLLLALICSLAADPRGRQQSLPRTRASLYQAVVWQFLSGAHRAAERGAAVPALDQEARLALLRVLTRVALAFADTPRGWIDRMPHAALLEAIRGAGDALADLACSPVEVLEKLAGQAGFLVPVGNPADGEQDYVFLHRTIAEYLVARHLSDLPADRRMRVIKEHQWFDPDWAEVIPMTGGLLAATDPNQASALITFFLDQRPDPMHYAFRTALRILGDAVGPLLTTGQETDLCRKTSALFAGTATRDLLADALSAAGAWPASVTTALLGCLTDADRDLRVDAAEALARWDTPEVNQALIARLADQEQFVRSAAQRALAAHVGPDVIARFTEHLGSPDRGTREEAAGALARRVAPDAVAALLGRLAGHDQDIRDAAIWELGQRDEPEVTATLLGCLTDRNEKVRRAAATALAGRDAPEVTAALVPRLTDRNDKVRRAAATALAGRDAPEVTAALIARLTDEHSAVRLAIARALARRDSREATAALLNRLTDQSGGVRWAAVEALAECHSPEVTAALIARLTDQDDDVRAAAVTGLARRRAEEVTTALVSSITDKDPAVRVRVAAALARRDAPEATAALLTLLNDQDAAVRVTAERALVRRGAPETTAGYIAQLSSQDWLVRRTAVGALASSKGPEVTAAILARLHDAEWPVRVAAAGALAGREALEVTAALLACLADQNAHVRRAAVGVLARREDPEVTAALMARLTDKDEDVRRAAIGAMARRDGPQVTVGLLAGLTDKDPIVRAAAAAILAGRDGPKVTAALLALLSDRNMNVRHAAAEALAIRDEAKLLLRLAVPLMWAAQPNRLQERFLQASGIADRAYLKIPEPDRARIRRRLGRLTRRI